MVEFSNRIFFLNYPEYIDDKSLGSILPQEENRKIQKHFSTASSSQPYSVISKTPYFLISSKDSGIPGTVTI